ncbi:hypothetical protein [Baekduia alba]|uniref:hypothetical protein n=1 Tax=Baekduia alba TaxID=2997333 RepID=UPI002341DBBB|nr:hypothetical protein [Baekduia alba]
MALLRAGAATLLAAVGLAVMAPMSNAGTYQVMSFMPGWSNAEGWSVSSDAQGRGYVGASMSTAGAVGTWNVGGGRTVFMAPEYTMFSFAAPANTTLNHIDWLHEVAGLGGGDWNTIGRDASRNYFVDVPAHNGAGFYSADVSGSSLQFLLQCGGPHTCVANENASYRISGVTMRLNDNYAPTHGSVSGALTSAAKLRGSVGVSFPATDLGSGLSLARIFDGATEVTDTVVDGNGGHCRDLDSRKYDRNVPCLLSATAAATLDTSALADGNHSLKVTLEDAAGNSVLVWGPETKLVANHPPVNTAVPVISKTDASFDAFSAPHAGVAMTFLSGGAWTGPSLAMAYAWLRCDRDGGNCAQIPDASTLSYTPTSDDVGHTLKLASTATNVADSVTVYSAKSGEVTVPKSATEVTDKPSTDPPAPTPVVTVPALPTTTTTTTTTTNNSSTSTHTIIGHVVGEAAGVACPGEKATLRFQHVSGGRLSLGFGKASMGQLELTCTTTGKPIADAKLEIATKTGGRPAVASDVTTDGAGHATIRLAQGASRGITVGYRMYSDDAVARATATLKVLVKGKVALKANRKHLHNRQAVTLRGALAGGLVPKRGVALAVQWKDGKRWRPFAQIKTDKNGRFSYGYRFTRTNRAVVYRLRVQIVSGQVDYPYVSVSSKPVKVTVGR